MTNLLSALGNPENKLPPVVHVAGTNGKGSVLATLRAILEAAGLRVHVYTSPHLVRFHERIRLAGKLIDEADLVRLLEACEQAAGGHPITFFEVTTAAAFLAFSQTPADIVLLETGLGGRLDATNVINKPALTVITPVAMDHEGYLGDTLAKIAAEKAGILKEGVPCVMAAQQPEADAVIRKVAGDVGAPVVDWSFQETADGFVVSGRDHKLSLPRPCLKGAHQIANAALATAAIMTLDDIAVGPEAVKAGLAKADWPARLQALHYSHHPLLTVLPAGSELWLDGAHNRAAAEGLASEIKAWPGEKPWLVLGMLNNRDVANYLEPLLPQLAGVYGVAIPGEGNSHSADHVAHCAAGCAAESVEEALQQIAAKAGAPVKVVIAGSLYLAGHVLQSQPPE